MTQVQKNTLAKLDNGQLVSLNYKNPGGIKLVTLNSLKKLGYIEFTRISQKSYIIKLTN